MSIEDRKLNTINKSTALNPNAEAFVPSFLRSINDASKRSDSTMAVVLGPSKETSTDQPESIAQTSSDEEAHQFWQQQLPDDITPDFKADEIPAPNSLSFTGLSINDGIGASIFSPNQTLSMQNPASPFIRDKLSTRPKIEFPGPVYVDEQSQATIMSPTAGSLSPTAAPWIKTGRNGGQYSTNRRDVSHYNGDSSIGGSLHNLTDAYHGSSCTLNSTMDTMNQLKQNKIDARLSQNLMSLSFGHSSSPSQATYAQNGLTNYSKETFGVPNGPYSEHVSLESPRGRYKVANVHVSSLGSSRGSPLLGGPYNGHDGISTNTSQNVAGIQTGLALLESDAMANSYLESSDEAYDFSIPRHAFLEQDRKAFLTGSNPKELTLKELYNIQGRLALEKARETTYHQRFQMPELQGLIQEQNPPIDLCGLHVSEAIHVLNYELNNRRKIVRSTGHRLQVIIISSTRHPARLTIVIEQYLVEHGLQYMQVQPGLFRVLLQ